MTILKSITTGLDFKDGLATEVEFVVGYSIPVYDRFSVKISIGYKPA